MQVKSDNICAVQIPNKLTATEVEAFDSRLANALQTSPSHIHLDCSLIVRPVSSHINLLMQAHGSCLCARVKVTLTGIHRSLVRVLQILDLYDYLLEDLDLTAWHNKIETAHADQLVNHKHKRQFKATINDIDKVANSFHTLLAGLRFPDLLIIELETIFYEVAMNIYLHAGLTPDDDIIFITTIDNEKITMQFVDSGRRFDPTDRIDAYDPEQAIRSRQSRGFGLAMVKRMVDRLSYTRRENRDNVFTIEKWLTVPER